MKYLLLLLLVPAMLFAAIEGRFMQYPDIRNDQIVFTYEEDIWLVSANGGMATRLTSHPGLEYAAKISPDGQSIAFTGNYDQGNNVYLMPLLGGVPTRLTYQYSDARTVAWTPDGKKIIFRSGAESTYRPISKLFAVTTDGAMPEKLPIPQGVLCSFSADGKKILYNSKGNEEYYWKRYKGGQYQDIWLYDYNQKSYSPVTDYVGKNSYPMWIGTMMYFVSDRGSNGIANLYSYDFAGKKYQQVTQFNDFDVQMASCDGQRIVFMNSGYLYVFDPKTASARKISITLPTDRWKMADRTINPKDYIQSMSVSNDGKTAVFEARGDVYLVPNDDTLPVINLSNAPSSRERFAQISPDGKTVAFISDKSGEYQIYTCATEANSPWMELTADLHKTIYHLEWSPDGQKILFSDKDFTLFYLDVASKKMVKIDSSNMLANDEFTWEVSDYGWSPDSKWICYSFVQTNRNNKIFLYSLEQSKIFPLTNDFYDNLNPSFDANGEFLYFLSYRNFDVRMDVFEDDHVIANPVQVMAVQLKAGQKPPFEKPAKDVNEKKSESTPLRIDLAGIENRMFVVPVKAGNYFHLRAGKGKIIWDSIDTFGEDEYEELFRVNGADKWDVHIFDMATQKENILDSKQTDWRLSVNREQMITRKNKEYAVNTVDKAFSGRNSGDRLSLDKMSYTVKEIPEWNQIFSDAWRWYRDFFYDANMHGRDWKKMGETYRAYIPQLNSRSDLNWVLSQMVGELCVSHTYIGGGDFGTQPRPDISVFTGLLGADLVAGDNGYYRFARIYGPTDFNREVNGPLSRPDIAIKEGDYLISIEGKEVRYPDNPYRYLQVVRGQKVKITTCDKPSATGAKSYDVEPIRSEYSLRYNNWVWDNLNKVQQAGNGDIGYLHLTAMSSGNVAQFDKFWRAFRYKKGLIIDVRGNGGGWTEYFMIDKLERKLVAYNNLVNMLPYRYPNSASTAYYAVLSNEANGSDGEAFIEHFKARKLGTVIGVPSWGGLVGIVNGQNTIDNGRVEQSNNAFYGREGKWLVENHGADPDILQPNEPAELMKGRDQQLEKGIEVLMKQIKEQPFTFPAKPAYPVK